MNATGSGLAASAVARATKTPPKAVDDESWPSWSWVGAKNGAPRVGRDLQTFSRVTFYPKLSLGKCSSSLKKKGGEFFL